MAIEKEITEGKRIQGPIGVLLKLYILLLGVSKSVHNSHE